MNQQKQAIKEFDKAYKKAKKLGFENYFCLPHTTWKEAHEKFKKGQGLLEETHILRLQQNVNVVLDKRVTKLLPYCKKCKYLFSNQEFVSGFKNCEHCDVKKKPKRGKKK